MCITQKLKGENFALFYFAFTWFIADQNLYPKGLYNFACAKNLQIQVCQMQSCLHKALCHGNVVEIYGAVASSLTCCHSLLCNRLWCFVDTQSHLAFGLSKGRCLPSRCLHMHLQKHRCQKAYCPAKNMAQKVCNCKNSCCYVDCLKNNTYQKNLLLVCATSALPQRRYFIHLIKPCRIELPKRCGA